MIFEDTSVDHDGVGIHGVGEVVRSEDGRAGRARSVVRCGEGVLSLVIEQPTPDVQVVRISGELDMLTTPFLETHVRRCIEARGGHVVVDLHRVSFLGASGLGCLVTAQQSANDHGVQLHLTGADHRVVAHPLEIAKLGPDFDIHPTVDCVVAALNKT